MHQVSIEFDETGLKDRSPIFDANQAFPTIQAGRISALTLLGQVSEQKTAIFTTEIPYAYN